MNVWFCSDLHLGHKNIEKFRTPLVSSCEDNTTRIVSDWNKNVTKRDTVYVLGDAVFDSTLMPRFSALPGVKYLVRGNHDTFPTQDYMPCFKEIYGLLKYKEFWLSHAPIHPDELRGKVNLHGHVHYATIMEEKKRDFTLFGSKAESPDPHYLNCCPENFWPTFGSALVSLDQIRNYLKRGG